MWSALTAILPGKAGLTVLFPSKEAIPPLLTQAILGLRQVTAQLLPRAVRQAGSQATPCPRTVLLPRKPVQSALTALLQGNAVLTALLPRKEAIPPLLTQATLGLSQVTAQHHPRQLGSHSGLGLPRQTVLFPWWIVRSLRQVGLPP